MKAISNFFLNYWRDALDILLVAYIIYRIILFMKGTRAVRILIGIAMIIVAYFISQKLGFVSTQWLLNNFLIYIVLILVILFQAEIRRALSEMGKNPLLSELYPMDRYPAMEEIINASISLANKGVGALIVLERQTGLKNYIEGGIPMEAKVTRDLLISIFLPPSPLHDGAVIVQKGKIMAASCFLPLSLDKEIRKELGTRHRAAIGLTEETDAVVIVVSEERGTVSLAIDGKLDQDLEIGPLRSRLYDIFQPPKGRFRRRIGG